MWLSIMGMYEHDETVFRGLTVPEGIDREALINEILFQCAELEIVYPNIDTMKLAITTWSIANQYTWEKLYNTMKLDYNPIWNVDAEIDHNNRVTGSDNRSVQKYNTTTPNTTNEHSVQGFNSSQWSQSEKDVVSGTVQDNGSITDNNTDDNSETFHERRTGNIGVTTTQKMIKEERAIAEFSIINYIVQSFKTRFCILIY